MSPARRKHLIENTEQLEAMVSPLRQEIVDAVENMGECAIKEVADVLGRPQKSLHYHFRHLVRVGLLELRGTRRSGARKEQLYRTIGYPMICHFDSEDPANVAINVAGISAMVRLADRDQRAALESGIARVKGTRRNTHARRKRAWLTRDDLAQINVHLDMISRIVNAGGRSPGSELHSITLLLARIPEPQQE